MIIECTGNAEPASKREKRTPKDRSNWSNMSPIIGTRLGAESGRRSDERNQKRRVLQQTKNRRGEIIRTLEHVQKEQRTVDENKEWIDRAAYESRCQLLDSLADWYVHETTRIDDALTRITEGRYGVCLGCHAPIEPHRLETAPDAAFVPTAED